MMNDPALKPPMERLLGRHALWGHTRFYPFHDKAEPGTGRERIATGFNQTPGPPWTKDARFFGAQPLRR
jgi:hypothetical protein